MRIQAEFVEGFGSLAELGAAVSVFGSRPYAARRLGVPDGERLGGALVDAGYGVITGGGPGVMEAANKGATRGRRRLRRARHRVAVRAGPQRRTSTWASTSATSSPARPCSSSTRRATSCLPGGFGTLDELFEALTLAQTAQGHPVSDRADGHGVLAWSAGMAAGHRRGRAEDQPPATSTFSPDRRRRRGGRLHRPGRARARSRHVRHRAPPRPARPGTRPSTRPAPGTQGRAPDHRPRSSPRRASPRIAATMSTTCRSRPPRAHGTPGHRPGCDRGRGERAGQPLLDRHVEGLADEILVRHG